MESMEFINPQALSSVVASLVCYRFRLSCKMAIRSLKVKFAMSLYQTIKRSTIFARVLQIRAFVVYKFHSLHIVSV